MTVDREADHCDPTANGHPPDCGPPATSEEDVFAPEAEELEPEDEVEFEEDTDSGTATRSSSEARRERVRVKTPGEWATIRRYANSYVIGNVRDGWLMGRREARL